ncbi:hypothetical protein J6590_045069 [Homalodisca vitripennis]|nr:hypothetical protein J6590_045069 [Homalodisca vitripennis]
MEFKTFACYNNFVPSNNCGVPDHTPNHNALLHLERLLQSLTQLIMEHARRIVQSRTEVDLILTDFDKDKREAIVSLPRKIAVKYTAGHDCQHQKSSTIFNNKQYTEENSV